MKITNKQRLLKFFSVMAVLFLAGCQAEEIFTESSKQANKFAVKKISYRELKRNEPAFEKYKEVYGKSSSRLSRKGIYNDDYGVFIDTSQIITIEKDGLKFITMKIETEHPDKIDNLVLASDKNGSYYSYITTYQLTENELQQLINGETILVKSPSSITSLETSSRINIGGNGADCMSVTESTIKYCEDSSGNTVENTGDNNANCSNWWEETVLVLVIDQGCLIGGGGGPESPGAGSPGTGSPGGSFGPGGGGGNNSGGNPNYGGGNPPTENPTPPNNNGGNVVPPQDPSLTDPNGNPITTTPILTMPESARFFRNLPLQAQKDYLNSHASVRTEIDFFINSGGDWEFAKEVVELMRNDNTLSFIQATTLVIVNNLEDPISGDPIELYLLAKYKNSTLLDLSSFSISDNSIEVGSYTLVPHYNNSQQLVFYSAVRYSSINGTLNGIEYVIRPDGLSLFQSKIDLYTSAANLVYMNGVPSDGQIAMAAGDYVIGLKEMWADALTDPQYYIYLAHIFVASATNLNSVQSSSTTFEGKIKFTSITQGVSDVNIRINNRSYTQYRQLIQSKYPNGSWLPNSSGAVENFIVGNVKYTGRFQNSGGFAYVIDYYRNGVLIGKFKFLN